MFSNSNIPFVRIRYFAYAISIVIILAGLVGLFSKGLNWSIDFVSGTRATINLRLPNPQAAPIRVEEIRALLGSEGINQAEIQSTDTEKTKDDKDLNAFIIKIKNPKDDGSIDSETMNKISKLLSEKYSEYVPSKKGDPKIVDDISFVGKKVGDELRSGAIIAVFIALILIVIYIWFRFELIFGVMAIVALFHDVLCIVGIFALTGKEITFQIIAALLTIVGYSINDTIVIFDRIREDVKLNPKEPYEGVFNRSMNRTLSRTIITSGTTLLTALALYFFGGTVLHDFAFAMVLGVVFGTYSSVFVASNLVIDWYHITHKEKKSLAHLTKKKK